jgi:DDE superfamily endonuclease
VIVQADSRRVEYLSATYAGKKHDKKICDEENYTFPLNSELYKDTGFQGYEPEHVITYQPKKKPRGGELTIAERMLNTIISRARITVEHVIAGVKRCRIVKDVFRNTKAGFDDMAMEIACGLHNLRTASRHPHDSCLESLALW